MFFWNPSQSVVLRHAHFVINRSIISRIYWDTYGSIKTWNLTFVIMKNVQNLSEILPLCWSIQEFIQVTYTGIYKVKFYAFQLIKLIAGEKPYQCNTCHSKFSTSGGLHLHLNTHLTDKKFLCHFCNQRFVSQRYCIRHIKVMHKDGYVKTVGERKCKFCEKTFASPSACARHVRIHTGEYYFRE